eukprot:jgi/Astpho2/6752/Aster-06767
MGGVLVQSPIQHKAHGLAQLPGAPASRRRRSSSEERQPRQPRQPPAEISLLLERSRRGAGGQGVALESLQVLTSDSIRDVQLRLRNLTAWFRPEQHALVLGDRRLQDHEVIGQLIRDAHHTWGPGYLHVFVRLDDIQSLQVESRLGQLHHFQQQPQDSPRSALTASLTASPRPPVGPSRAGKPVAGRAQAPGPATRKGCCDSLILRSQLVDSPAVCLLSEAPASDGATTPGALLLSEQDGSNAVVHLVIQRSAQVGWRHSGTNFELSVRASDTAESVKQRLEQCHGLPADGCRLLLNGKELRSGRSLAEYGVSKGTVLELVPLEPITDSSSAERLHGSPLLSSPEHQLFEDWQKARAGLAKGHAPRLAPAGTGGSYFISGEDGMPVALFKPNDEEPLARNNPRGRGSSGGDESVRKGVLPGEGAVREVAAFVLDHQHFAGVPPTALVSCQQRTSMDADSVLFPMEDVKVGSLQHYVRSEGDCEERGCSSFPVEEVHKIAVLDIRLANTDRNAGNILVEGDRLIPIDHGMCLPSSWADVCWEWQYWRQAKVPFSKKTRDYIASLDVERDLSLLAAHGLALRAECTRVFRASSLLLQKAAARGMTPYAIASIMCRDAVSKSWVERLHSHVLQVAVMEVHGVRAQLREGSEDPALAVSDAIYMKHFSALLDEWLDQAPFK